MCTYYVRLPYERENSWKTLFTISIFIGDRHIWRTELYFSYCEFFYILEHLIISYYRDAKSRYQKLQIFSQ